MKIHLPDPNPVLLFELRQAVRNRFVLVLMSLYLVVLVGFLGLNLLAWESGRFVFSLLGFLSVSFYDGEFATRFALEILLLYYAFSTIILVGFGAARTISDRLYENPVWLTGLTPRRVVSGKMQFGFVLGILFMSLTLPFLSVIYRMRGLDLRFMFLGLLFYFLLSQIQYFATVALFSWTKTWPRIFLTVVAALILHFPLVFFAFTGAPYILHHFMSRESFVYILMLFFIFPAVMTPLFFLTTVQMSPETSNRMLPVRIALTVVQLVLLLALPLGISFFGAGSHDAYRFAAIPNLLFWLSFPYLFIFLICERDGFSFRIRQTIPDSFRWRLFLFPFYTGAAGAMLWALGMLVLEMSILTLFVLSFPRIATWSNTMGVNIFSCLSFGILFFDYCASVLLLSNALFHRWIPRAWNWTLPFVLVGGVISFLFFATLTNRFFGIEPFGVLEGLVIMPLPWMQDNADFVYRQFLIGFLWTVVLIFAGFRWTKKQFDEFQAPSVEEIRQHTVHYYRKKNEPRPDVAEPE